MGTDEARSGPRRLGGDSLVGRILEHFDALSAAREQVALLLQTVTEIASDSDIQSTLYRIVDAAIGLTGARYAGLGVRGPEGTLAAFLHNGIDAETIARIRSLPAGAGMVGAMLNRTEPLRLDDLAEYPAARDLSDYQPPMRAFLGVPLTIHGEIYGSLYLSDDRPQFAFSKSDEATAVALASAATAAVVFDRAQTAVRWITASREITTTLLAGGLPPHRSLQLIAERACELTAADQVVVLVPTNVDNDADQTIDVDTLTITAAVGTHSDQLVGLQVPVDGSTAGEVFRTGTATITTALRYPIAAFTDQGPRPVIVVPLHQPGATAGVIAVARGADQPPFDTQQLAMAEDFAGHAAVALSLAKASAQAERLTVLADRERIARDLHDRVIQQLFITGMDLQGTLAQVRSPVAVQRLTHTIDDLQSTIDDIRTVIFELQTPAATAMHFRQRVQTAVADLTENTGLATTLLITGEMMAIEPTVADHAEAVVIEAISNTVRHSEASRLIVDIAASDELTIAIIDNGRGIPAENQRRSGLANLVHRAQQCGGTCQITSTPGCGTEVYWTAPIEPRQSQPLL